MLLEGMFLPLTTPFHPDGRLFPHKLEYNVGRYSLTPAAGMLVLGSAGEAGGLSDREVSQALSAAISAAGEAKVMVAAVGRESVRATVDLADYAAATGYDAIAVRGPEFAGDAAMQLAVATYFQAVADRSALPVVLVSERGRPLSVELAGELARHPQVIGLVDSDLSAERLTALLGATAGLSREVTVTSVFAAATGRMLRKTSVDFVPAESLAGGIAVASTRPQLRPQLKTRTKRVGFQILAGSTGAMLDAWTAGASGGVPRLGACAPQACCEVWQAFKDGDEALAAEKQVRVRNAGAMVEGWKGIAALKYGCDLNGYFGGRARLPLLPLSAEERFAMERALAGLKN